MELTFTYGQAYLGSSHLTETLNSPFESLYERDIINGWSLKELEESITDTILNWNFVLGTLEGWVDANSFNLPSTWRHSSVPESTLDSDWYFSVGKINGSCLAIWQGIAEMGAGGGGAVLGVFFAPGTLGTSLAVEPGAGALIVHGGAVSSVGAGNLCREIYTLITGGTGGPYKKSSEGKENLSDSIDDKALKQIKKKWGNKGVEAFKKAADKGMVAARGQNGVKVLKGGGIKIGGKNYTHEIKVLNKEYGDYRIFGYVDETGEFVFDQFQKGLH